MICIKSSLWTQTLSQLDHAKLRKVCFSSLQLEGIVDAQQIFEHASIS